jgi:carbon storage regulator
MLVLSRRSGESIIINDNIEVKIVEIKGDYVKMGITAPRSIPVHRKEIFEAIQRENAKAAQSTEGSVGDLEENLPPVKPPVEAKESRSKSEGKSDSKSHPRKNQT